MAGLSFVGSGAGEDEEEGDFADMAYNLGAGKFLEHEVWRGWMVACGCRSKQITEG